MFDSLLDFVAEAWAFNFISIEWGFEWTRPWTRSLGIVKTWSETSKAFVVR